MWKNNDEEENLSHITDDEDGRKYQFDFQALTKIKRRERLKIYTLTFLVAILICALVAMVILYLNKKDSKQTIIEITDATKMMKARRIQAYTRISKYGEDCHSPIGSKNRTICGKNAYCRFLQGAHRCDCANGFVGDGIGDCKDVNFAIKFKHPTISNIPELKRILFPASDAISVCFWFKLDSRSSSRWTALFMYTSVEIPGDNDLMIWVTGNQFHAYMRSKGISILNKNLSLDTWTHLCWVWQSTGKFQVYLDGKSVKDEVVKEDAFRQTFTESSGSLILGQDKDEDTINQSTQMFHGTMTQFFLFNMTLTHDEVISVYESRPPNNNIVVGWWQFKNMTAGNDIVETNFPSESELGRKL